MAWKAFLISVAVLFEALGLKASLPFATTHLPLIWNLLLLCFKPPYLYVIVNAIIISIVASSRFRHSNDTAHPTPPPFPAYQMKSPVLGFEDPPVLEVKAVVVNGSSAVEEKTIDDGTEKSAWIDYTEKPLVSARFGRRKPLKSSPQGGKALRVAKPKRHETLESTWKAITEGRPMPLSRHINRCDTWQDSGNTGPLEVKKSATFNDRTNQQPLPPVSVPGKLRKEPSLSQDELNRRVEAFIHNFNQQMRLQRQESLNQYMQMIDRGPC